MIEIGLRGNEVYPFKVEVKGSDFCLDNGVYSNICDINIASCNFNYVDSIIVFNDGDEIAAGPLSRQVVICNGDTLTLRSGDLRIPAELIPNIFESVSHGLPLLL
jgi:hypothetical protein